MRTKVSQRVVRAVVATAMLAGIGQSVAAQEGRTVRYYVVPKVPGGPLPGGFVPKYIPLTVQWQAMDYGLENTYLVGANVTDAQHASFSSNIDVISIPPNLDGAIGLVAVDQIRAGLSSLRVPFDW